VIRNHRNLAAATFTSSGAPRAELVRRSLVAVALGTAALFALLTQLGENGIVALWQLKRETTELNREVADLQQHNDRMKHALEALANDPETLERIARRYGFRREGEEVLQVLPQRGVRSQDNRPLP